MDLRLMLPNQPVVDMRPGVNSHAMKYAENSVLEGDILGIA